MTLRSCLSGVRRQVLRSVHVRSASLNDQVPIVSFSFDDFPRTAWTCGGSILNASGVKGTYYAAPGLIDTQNKLGDQMTWHDIEAVLSNGHELGCHTFSHCSCRKLS